jgi:hypothetical protein
MTIRRLASAILAAAVRWASPAVREWGNAMLREMDLVEGDWAALFWALGSATALFRGLEVPAPMLWFKRVLVALPMAVAAVLTVLNFLAYPCRLIWHPKIVAKFGFLFSYPWTWLLDHDWFGYLESRLSVQLIIAYATFFWIPAMLYSGCVVLLFRFLRPTLGRMRRQVL